MPTSGTVGCAMSGPPPEAGIYEVFIRFRREQPFQHAGSVRAADAELARRYAQDVFLRRDRYLEVWVVPRECIVKVERDPWLDGVKFRQTEYRRPSYFTPRLRARGFQKVPALSVGEE